MANQKTVNLSQYYYRKSEIDAFINGGTLNGKHIYDHAHDYSKVTVTPKKDSGIEIAQIKVDDTTYSIKQQDNNTTYTPANTKPLTDSITGNIGVSEKYAREDHAHPKYDYTSLQGTNNTTGYINLIKITINNSYVDKPIVIKTQHRDKIERSVIQIKFSNTNNADPSLQSITHTGQDMEFYLYKESPSNWILICGKGHNGKYDDVYIKIDNPNTNISISKLGTHLETLPTSNITQSTYTGLNIKENISNKSSSISEDTGSTSKYPTIKAVEDYTQNTYQAKLQQANKTDLNEAITEGWYNINCGTPNNIENIPTALNNVSFYGKLEVKNYNNNYITQVLYVMETVSTTHNSNPRIFYRNKPGSYQSFDTDWREIVNTNDIDDVKTYVDSEISSTLSSIVDGSQGLHEHTASQVKDSNANTYTNISSSLSNTSTQQDINSAINTKISSLTNIDLVRIVTTTNLPTASASTMNQLYLYTKQSGGTEKNHYDIYVTVKDGLTYKWEKIDDFDLQLPTIDSTVANNANHLVTSKAVYDYAQPTLEKGTYNSGDLNDTTFMQQGWYKLNCTTANAISNLPYPLKDLSNLYCTLEVRKYNDNYMIQTLYANKNDMKFPKIFYRKKGGISSDWDLEWKEVNPTTNIAGYVDDDFIMCLGDSRNLSITASKECIQTDETVTLVGFSDTATSLDFYKGNTKIGTSSVIDDCAAFTYTGNGSGVLNFSVKDGSSQSETFVVTDCLWYDDCLPDTHNTNWFNRNNLLTEYTSNGLKLTGGTNSGNYMPNKDGTLTSITDVTEWISPFILELDIVDFDNASYSNIGIGSVGRSLSQLGITSATHLRIVYDGSTVKYYKDNSTTETYSANLTTSPIYISIGVSSEHNITIKDVKIYPLYDTIPTTLTVSANNPTIITGETSTLTITAKGENNYPVKNAPIDIYQDNVKITTLTTDNTGKVSYIYTGTGKGKTEFIAKYSSIQSEIFVLEDTLFYDVGIGSIANSKWDCNLVTRSVEPNGTKFLVTSTSASARASTNPIDNASAYDFNATPFVFEFDLVGYSANGACQAQVIQNTPSTINKVFSLRSNSYVDKTVKITYDSSKLKLYVDNTFISEQSVTYDSSNNLRIGFAFGQKDDYLIVKNVKVYPLF